MNILIVGGLGTNGSRLKQFYGRGHHLTYLSTFYFVDELWDFKDGTLKYEHFQNEAELSRGRNFEERIWDLIRRDAIDLIYCPLNCSDGSNTYTARLIAMDLQVPIVRHYKEHLCRYDELEKEVLTRTDGQVYENVESLAYFRETYAVGDNHLIALGDPPQYETFVPSQMPPRLSEGSDEIHVVSFASGNNCCGRGADYGRYSIEEVAEVLAAAGIHIHIYGHMPSECQSLYDAIKKRYPDFLHLHGFVDSRTTCEITARHDWGLIYSHPKHLWPFLEDTRWHFNRMNSPGKMAQYIAAGVPFFLKRGIYDFMERVLLENGFGFLFDDYDDLIRKLRSCPRGVPYRQNLELYKNRFSMEVQADKMLNFFQATIECKREMSSNGLSGKK